MEERFHVLIWNIMFKKQPADHYALIITGNIIKRTGVISYEDGNKSPVPWIFHRGKWGIFFILMGNLGKPKPTGKFLTTVPRDQALVLSEYSNSGQKSAPLFHSTVSKQT
jgi:hypothetical protein